jgi:hypothetical protein
VAEVRAGRGPPMHTPNQGARDAGCGEKRLRPRSSTSTPSNISAPFASRNRRAVILGMALGATVLTGCERYPPAEDVASCAADRFGTQHGVFNVTEQPRSMVSARKYMITYQKAGSPDRATVVYYPGTGPVTTQVEISYGNHAEIAGAVDAIKYCAQPR